MAPKIASVRSDPEVTVRQSQVALPMLGAARTDHALTSGQLTDGDWILPLVKRAQERVMSQKAAILTMGIAKTQYIENLQGTGHLSIRKLGLMGEDFWRALIDELREHFHMDDDAERLSRAIDGVRAGLSVIAEIAVKAVNK